ncbi:MAG: family 65 glycosyl hydrolase domain-containing protein [Breznakibacter sp.]
MKPYLVHDEWCIIEEGFKPEMHKSSESIFSLGNGKMGQRANFEEHYSGPTLRGSYVAGIYYPDKTRVGWWKNGYPEYFAKVLNSPNYIGINIWADGEMLDLYTCRTKKFRRVLNMQEGTLTRSFEAILPSGKTLKVETLRFLSMVDTENAAIRYAVTPVNFSGKITFEPYIDGDVENEDANYDEKFWHILSTEASQGGACLLGQTKKLDFRVAFAMAYHLQIDSANATAKADLVQTAHLAANKTSLPVNAGQTATIYKYVAVCSNLNHAPDTLTDAAKAGARHALTKGFETMLGQHKQKWAEKWTHSDIRIDGDVAAQQGIRFNIFHLNQTYTGEDARLNIGPKGFTGEKYGGSTYWDTEAYCIPFYVSTAPKEVTRQLLVYRYKHLQKAIENARKLGFTSGAALYPMVTMNGEECHNEWEITFEEIHRNGAIAFAIHNYIRHTGDYQYLEEYGLEVLIGIARFWSQRATWSEQRKKYVILGVTGPNEYENNVNNNWYTNKFAVWCLRYAAQCIDAVRQSNPARLNTILRSIDFDLDAETTHWANIVANMHFPFNDHMNVFMQQDNYMDKEQLMARDLDPAQRPINQHWSWDRILRSCFIKQADTLQGIYVFEDEFDLDTIRRNFEFYEPRTVHESSLSPCVHAVLAAKTGHIDKAYEMYLRTSRLDLDDYNHEVHERPPHHQHGRHLGSRGGRVWRKTCVRPNIVPQSFHSATMERIRIQDYVHGE